MAKRRRKQETTPEPLQRRVAAIGEPGRALLGIVLDGPEMGGIVHLQPGYTDTMTVPYRPTEGSRAQWQKPRAPVHGDRVCQTAAPTGDPLEPYLDSIIQRPGDQSTRMILADFLSERPEMLGGYAPAASALLRCPGEWRLAIRDTFQGENYGPVLSKWCLSWMAPRSDLRGPPVDWVVSFGETPWVIRCQQRYRTEEVCGNGMWNSAHALTAGERSGWEWTCTDCLSYKAWTDSGSPPGIIHGTPG